MHTRDNRFGLILLLIAAALFLPRSARADFVPHGESHSFQAAPSVYEWSFEETRGPSPFDKIGLHRVSPFGPKLKEAPQVVVLYLPGTNMNGAVAPDDVDHSLALYLATHGVDFWAMDYRTHYVPSTASQSDLKELRGWTNELFAGDIDAAVNFVRQKTHHERIFLAGFSRGVEFEYLYTALHPKNVQGLIVLDGFLPLHPSRAPPEGLYADDLGGRHLTFDKRKTLMQMVIANPDGPAPIPKYKTARDNLAHVVYDTGGVFGGKGGLANPIGGYSDPVRLAKLLITYDRWWPAIQDYENPFTPERLAALKSSQVPVIAFSSTNIAAQWPSWVEQSAHSTGSNDVKVTKLGGRGHLDVLCGNDMVGLVFDPIVEWLKRHQK
jgi:pimeloyl-ACP methyl ester carboxylesterase